MLILVLPPQQIDTLGQALESLHSAQAAAAPGGRLTAETGLDDLGVCAALVCSDSIVTPKGQTPSIIDWPSCVMS
jgi:hypothetical protein